MSIYKKFTAQDISTVPFNAHKQYSFTSASAASHRITYFNTSWTSESISLYSSASAVYGGATKNIIKYNQIDHLFYKNFKRDIGNKFGNIHYLNQRRDLYEKTNILSIPAGLYGFEIKPSTFLLETNGFTVVDDLNGNLIISGTNLDNYPTDIRSNLFRLDPIKSFKNIDLNTYDGHINGTYYLDGKRRINGISHYGSPDQGEFDDSYYFNPIKYNNVQFTTSSLGSDKSSFSHVVLDSFKGANIISPDSEKFNFNKNEDFSISFWMKPTPFSANLDGNGNIIPPVIGQRINDGIVFHVEGDDAYVAVTGDPTTVSQGYIQTYDVLNSISAVVDSNNNNNLSNGDEASEGKPLVINPDTAGYINANGINGPFTSMDMGVTSSNFQLLTLLDQVDTLSNSGYSVFQDLAHHPFIVNSPNSVNTISDFTVASAVLNGSTTVTPNSVTSYLGNNFLVSNGNNTAPVTIKEPLTEDLIPGETYTISYEVFSSDPTKAHGWIGFGANHQNFGDGTYSHTFIATSAGKPDFFFNELNNSSLTFDEISVIRIKLPLIGGGKTNTENLLNFLSDPIEAPLFNFIAKGGLPQGYNDTWVANYDEIYQINNAIGFTNDINEAKTSNKIFLASNNLTNQNVFNVGSVEILSSNFYPRTSGVGQVIVYPYNISDATQLGTQNLFGGNPYGSLAAAGINQISDSPAVSNIFQPPNAANPGNIVIVRKIKWRDLDILSRYIVAKSATKTVVPSPIEGRAQLLNTRVSGSSQFKDVSAEPQFPFEIYHQSSSIYFDRSDGDITTSVKGEIKSNLVDNPVHILCQKTGSNMEIYANGTKIASGSDNTNQTQNNANLYIGSRGNESFKDSQPAGAFTGLTFNELGELIYEPTRFFNGELGNINIYDKAFSSLTINNISESINGLPYLGNIFYQHGFATITHPKYNTILNSKDELILNGNFNGTDNWIISPSQPWTIQNGKAEANLVPIGSNTLLSNTFISPANKSYEVSYTISDHNYSLPAPATNQFQFVGGTGWGGQTSPGYIKEDFKILVSIMSPTGANFVKPFIISGNPLDQGVTLFGDTLGFYDGDNHLGSEAAANFINAFNSADNFIFNEVSLDENGVYVPLAVASLKPNTTDVVLITMGHGGSFQNNGFVAAIDINSRTNLSGPFPSFQYFVDGNDGFGGKIQAVLFGDNGSSATGIANFAQTADEDWVFTEILTPTGGGGTNSNLLTFDIVHDTFTGKIDNVSVKALEVPLNLKFQGSHLIFENEYQCTIDEYEFNDTLNISARKIKSNQSEDLANFATGSLFRPYITTIGLYNEDNELLVVGKLGQPIRTSDETDTTFVLRWDT